MINQFPVLLLPQLKWLLSTAMMGSVKFTIPGATEDVAASPLREVHIEAEATVERVADSGDAADIEVTVVEIEEDSEDVGVDGEAVKIARLEASLPSHEGRQTCFNNTLNISRAATCCATLW